MLHGWLNGEKLALATFVDLCAFILPPEVSTIIVEPLTMESGSTVDNYPPSIDVSIFKSWSLGFLVLRCQVLYQRLQRKVLKICPSMDEINYPPRLRWWS